MPTKSCPACVLLIEDDARLRESIGAFLEDRDYPTVIAEDGDQALELLETLDRPCLVLVDPLSQRVDCTRLVTALCAADRIATIPVVLVSVHAPELLSRPVVRRRLGNVDVLVHILKEHCCRGGAGGPRQSSDALHDTGGD